MVTEGSLRTAEMTEPSAMAFSLMLNERMTFLKNNNKTDLLRFLFFFTLLALRREWMDSKGAVVEPVEY